MPLPRTLRVLVVLLSASTVGATAQQPTAQGDSARAQIHTTLRAFYFNLAHRNWDALTADILAAKVVAHRPAPDALVMAARSPRVLPNTDITGVCEPGAKALVEQAAIALDGDWAEASVPQCPGSGVDEFRLIHFEQRWRLVYIDLFQEPMDLSDR